jgi:hypothetical protein
MVVGQPAVHCLGKLANGRAASFLTTVVIARWTIPDELGLYSIGISLLVSSVSIQESVIPLPYTIQ